MSSAAEAEVAGVFVNTKEGTTIRTTLEELGYPQPPTPVQVDNTTAVGIANDTVKQRRSKAIEMRFYWIRDRVKQGQFHIYWAPGKHNIADYFTKLHTGAHHQQERPYHVHTGQLAPRHLKTSVPPNLRGCVDTPEGDIRIPI
jgi:hypothetical protein